MESILKKSIVLLLLLYTISSAQTLEIGTFNIQWFPCKDNGEMMAKYGIDLKYPPKGQTTDVRALFNLLKELDIELLALNEIVDVQMVTDSAKKYLGDEFKFIYSPEGGSQKVGFLYDSSVLELVGNPETYANILLKPDSRLRPAFRAYFKSKPNGFDFHAIVVHLKASPRGWDQRQRQLQLLEGLLASLPEDSKDADIILLGDMNNVTTAGAGEFKPMMEKLGFYWASSELENVPTNYWKPDWKINRIQGSAIDHIFVSSDAKVEYVENTTTVGGVCKLGAAEYQNDAIPEYFNVISDHCPVYATFKVDIDND